MIAAVAGTGWPTTSSVAAVRTASPPDATLRARAAAIAATIEADNQRAAALGTRYLSERVALGAARVEAARTASAVRRLSREVAADRSSLAKAAVAAYVNSGTGGTIGLLFSGALDQLTAGRAYLGVATDQLAGAVSRFESQRVALRSQLLFEQAAAARVASALAATTASRASVLATAADEQQMLSGVRGQLATLIAEQVAARQRAAAAAAAAAARAAAAAAAARATSTTAAGSTATSTGATTTAAPASGPPSPGGLTATSAGSPIPGGTLANDFAGIRRCESGGIYTLDTGNGYYGAYQFSEGTWLGLGEAGLPSVAPPSTQDATAFRLYQGSGWSPWPECAAILGL